MKKTDFCKILLKLNIPCTHYEFSKPTTAPCLVWTSSEENMCADGVNVLETNVIRIELYHKPNNTTICGKFENLMTENKITFDKDEAFVSERREVMAIYNCYIGI